MVQDTRPEIAAEKRLTRQRSGAKMIAYFHAMVRRMQGALAVGAPGHIPG
jgi:hypothetical protein